MISMRKVRGHHLLFGASALMVCMFCAAVVLDWFRYNSTLNSAPFRLWILCDAIIWLLPALLAFVAGFVAKKKIIKKEKTQ